MRASRSSGIGAIAVALVLSIFGAFAIGVGVNTAWAQRTLLDTEGFLDTISRPLLADPAVKDALARDLSQQALGQIDLGAGLADFVPFELRVMADQLGDQVTDQLKAQLRPAIRSQLDTAFVTDLWDQASREVHRQLVEQLSTGTSATQIDVDLRPVLLRAIHDVGVAIQQNIQVPFVVTVFDGIANQLPSDIGTVPIDVSDVQGPTRFLIANATEIAVGATLVGVVSLALGLLVSRRRGLTVLVFGIGLVAAAAATYALFALSFADAGAKVADKATTPISPDLQQIIDAQAALIVASYRPWAALLAAAGIVIALIGVVWAALRRGPAGDGGSSGRPGYVADAPTPAMASGWTMPEAPPVR